MIYNIYSVKNKGEKHALYMAVPEWRLLPAGDFTLLSVVHSRDAALNKLEELKVRS